MSFFKGLTGEKILPWIDAVTDHGADRTASISSTNSINNAITAANALAASNGRGAVVFIPSGNYIIDGALTTISKSGVKIIGAGGRYPSGTRFFCSGSSNVFTVDGFAAGQTTMIKDITISGIEIFAGNKNKAGIIISTNAVDGFILDNFYVVEYGNGMLNTLTYNMLLRDVDFQWAQALNGYGWRMQGDGTSINGYENKVENVKAYNVNVATRYFKGDPGPAGTNDLTVNLVSCLGAVSNVYFDTVTFLKGATGLTIDQFDGSTGPIPRNIFAKNSDFEYNHIKGINARAVDNLQFDNIYSHGSGTDKGMDFGTKATNIKLTAVSCHDHWLQGIVFEGKGMVLTAADVYWNSQQSSGSHSGIYILGTDFVMIGGTSGVNPQRPSNTFRHAYGIDNAGTGRVQAIGVRLVGNVAGATNGTITSLGNITS